MKSEDVKQMATNAIETLAAALEAGKSDDLKRYLAAMGRFHRYSLHNVMLIALQKPTASHVVVTRHGRHGVLRQWNRGNRRSGHAIHKNFAH